MSKKISPFVFILFFVGNFLYSASITVIYPGHGHLYRAYSYTIKWVKSGAMDSRVKIKLMQGNTKVLDISNDTPNDGEFVWLVPTTIYDGNYKIRVKTLDNKVYGDSKMFEITSPQCIWLKWCPIRVNYPKDNDCWEKGKSYHIEWVPYKTMNFYVKIRLYQGNTKVLSITDSTLNDREFTWNIPASIPDGTYYIRVKTIDNQKYGDSELFRIKTNCPNLNSIGKFLSEKNWVKILLSFNSRTFFLEGMDKIRNYLEQAGINKPVTFKLLHGNKVVANLGTFSPVLRKGKVIFNSIPSKLKVNINVERKINSNKFYKLLIFGSGKIIGEKVIQVKR